MSRCSFIWIQDISDAHVKHKMGMSCPYLNLVDSNSILWIGYEAKTCSYGMLDIWSLGNLWCFFLFQNTVTPFPPLTYALFLYYHSIPPYISISILSYDFLCNNFYTQSRLWYTKKLTQAKIGRKSLTFIHILGVTGLAYIIILRSQIVFLFSFSLLSFLLVLPYFFHYNALLLSHHRSSLNKSLYSTLSTYVLCLFS